MGIGAVDRAGAADSRRARPNESRWRRLPREVTEDRAHTSLGEEPPHADRWRTYTVRVQTLQGDAREARMVVGAEGTAFAL